MLYWPEDGRPYVALGKLYSKQSRFDKARAAYERGCQATQGENPYIWQVCTSSPHFAKLTSTKIIPREQCRACGSSSRVLRVNINNAHTVSLNMLICHVWI